MKKKVVITPSSFGQVSSKPLEELKQYFDDEFERCQRSFQ